MIGSNIESAYKTLGGLVMKKFIVFTLVLILILSGCSQSNQIEDTPGNESRKGSKTDVFYEIFVRSFYDSNKDGVGDLNGVTKKLDYLVDLGVRGIWLMPINISPSGHGYDTTDYYNINPEYGTIKDLERLTKEADKRNIKVIMDLVVNHTGKEHPWFLDASTNVNSKYRNWYTFATENTDTGSFNPWGGGIAWHLSDTGEYIGVFGEHMPDLNFDNKEVREEIIKIGQFWLNKGIDGFRLDAAKHIYENFEEDTTNPDTIKKNVGWWQEFRAGLNEVNPNALLVGEIWDTPDVVAPYLNKAFNSGFNFSAAELIKQLANEQNNEYRLAQSIQEINEKFEQASNGTFIDAPFLSNHDQTRVITQLNGNKNKAKMAASMLLTLPGNPFIYYGEEIGMQGLKEDGDESLRTPMIWSAKKSEGLTTAYESYGKQKKGVNVEQQLLDKSSILNHYKTMIRWRNADLTLSDGKLETYKINNLAIAAWTRSIETKHSLVLHNLSNKEQTVLINGSDNSLQFKKISKQTGTGAKVSGNKVTIPAYSTVLMGQ